MFGAPWVATNLVLSIAILALAVLVQKLNTLCFNHTVLQVHSKGKTVMRRMRSITVIILLALVMLAHASLPAAALIGQITESATIKALLRMHRAQDGHFGHIQLSACWTSLARLAMQGLPE